MKKLVQEIFKVNISVLFCNASGLQRILTCIDSLKPKAAAKPEDLTFLKELLQATDFQALMKVNDFL